MTVLLGRFRTAADRKEERHLHDKSNYLEELTCSSVLLSLNTEAETFCADSCWRGGSQAETRLQSTWWLHLMPCVRLVGHVRVDDLQVASRHNPFLPPPRDLLVFPLLPTREDGC